MKKPLITLLAALGALIMSAAPAAADHTHSKEVRPGVCVLITNHNHQGVHSNVHRGVPGTKGNFRIGVYGTDGDPCVDGGVYLNG